MPSTNALTIDVISDVVCPWCYIGKRRLEQAIAQVPDISVTVRWRPFFLNPWVPKEGISRDDYLTKKFGSPEAYRNIAQRVVEAAAQEGLAYHPERVSRQPNTTDCHRVIHWAGENASAVKQKLMELYFRDGGDLTNPNVLSDAAASCGLDGESIRARLAGDDGIALVAAQAGEAAANGVSGVPTFIFAGRYAVSGAQDADKLARAIRQVSQEISAPAA